MPQDDESKRVELLLPDLSGFKQLGRRVPWRGLILAGLAAVALLGSCYTVGPEEIGAVLRFGQYVRTADPGLNFRLPFGIESVIKVPIERQLKQEFGFRTKEPGVQTVYVTEGFETESLMLTGDLNIADVEWVVQYRIVDPAKFLFQVRSVEQTVRDLSEAVMREVVGDRTVNEVLTIGRQEVASLVERDLQRLCDEYETGIKVEQVVLQNVTPPDAVKPSFNEVNQAQQEREQKINAAQSAYNQVVPKAHGEAQQTIQEAEGYALDRVNRAEGDATRFNALYTEYKRAPEVTRKRLYLEAMATVLPKAGRKIIVDEKAKGFIPLLNLDAGPTRRASGNEGGR